MPEPITTSVALEWLAPYLKDLAAKGLIYLGGRAIGGMLGSPEQQRYQEQLAMVQRLQPDYMQLLQKQMQGKPTAATEAIRRQVQQEGRAAQQALATSAARMGQAGTEVARAQQARIAAAETQQLMQELGRAQQAAMQQVGALTEGARREQALLAQQEASDISELTRYLMMGIGDLETRQLMNEILRELWNLQKMTFERRKPEREPTPTKPKPGPPIEKEPPHRANVKPDWMKWLPD